MLVAAVITLVAFPLLLPFPLAVVQLKWLYPMFQAQLSQCADLECQVQTETSWERLGWLLVLGPSMLIAAKAIIFGLIGLVRVRRQPTSPKDVNWLKVSLGFGIAWLLIAACLYGGIFWLAGVAP
jgi:uncharacterized membrane protein